MLRKKENGAAVGSGSQTLNTIIGRDTLFEGTMRVENSVRIDGSFKGELTCSGTLTISQSGEAYAHIEGKEIYINGIVRGTVRAEKVGLDSQARFIGDIYADTLAVSEGAIFHGSSSMEIDEEALESKINARGESSVEGKAQEPGVDGKAADRSLERAPQSAKN